MFNNPFGARYIAPYGKVYIGNSGFQGKDFAKKRFLSPYLYPWFEFPNPAHLGSFEQGSVILSGSTPAQPALMGSFPANWA